MLRFYNTILNTIPFLPIIHKIFLCVDDFEIMLFLFDNNKIKMARKPGKKLKENPVECPGEDKIWRGNIREGKTGTGLELTLEVK